MIVTQSVVCGLSATPIVLIWRYIHSLALTSAMRTLVDAAMIAPSYVLFALLMLVVSPAVTRLTRARTPPDAVLRIADLSWPLLRWAEYMVATHLVRVVAGGLFRGSPVWTLYLRLNGARIGRRVFVNTTSIADHNLLAFADDVVIGADVHLSGHTVEGGLLKTGRVGIGREVTVGLGSVIGIDVTIGDRTELGALTLVPKHTPLESDAIYTGIPARRLDTDGPPCRRRRGACPPGSAV